jgi:hypothetical protein
MTRDTDTARLESYLQEDGAYGLLLDYYDSWFAKQAAYDVWYDIVHRILPRQRELGLTLTPDLEQQAETALEHIESILGERFKAVVREFDLDLQDVPLQGEEDEPDSDKLGYMLCDLEDATHGEAVMSMVRVLRMRQRKQQKGRLS